MNPNELLQLYAAYRDSATATRPYVVVNPRLAKHLPCPPSVALDHFRKLGREVAQTCNKVGEKILVVGFAETATAVGAEVALTLSGLFPDCVYVHTTREKLPPELLLSEFREEHSHATEQALYLADGLRDLSRYDRIVFVEDEITTGHTIRNFLNNTAGVPRNVTIAALVFNGFNGEMFEDCPHKLDYACLMVTNAEQSELPPKPVAETTPETARTQSRGTPPQPRVTEFAFPDPRLGVNAGEYRRSCRELAETVRTMYPTAALWSKKILVLGTEECMLPALYIGEKLEAGVKSIGNLRKPLSREFRAKILSGKETRRSKALCLARRVDAVRRNFRRKSPKEGFRRLPIVSHSTTRSPLLPIPDEAGYPIRERREFPSVYEPARTTYLYNLEKYDLIIVVGDSDSGYGGLLSAIGDCGDEFLLIRGQSVK